MFLSSFMIPFGPFAVAILPSDGPPSSGVKRRGRPHQWAPAAHGRLNSDRAVAAPIFKDRLGSSALLGSSANVSILSSYGMTPAQGSHKRRAIAKF